MQNKKPYPESIDMDPAEAASSSPSETQSSSAKTWQSLSRNQRRVLGVLIEKSKTTPDVYPMSINGIKTGSNQKSNRSPVLDLNESQVEDTLYELRQLGVVIEVHSGGRVPKFKHEAYDWLKVDKPELGVLAELLLRGEQTIGELRARAARMEKSIAGLDELRPILQSLIRKNLLVELTPSGRGQVITHNLYRPEELQRLRLQFDSESENEGDESIEDQSEPTVAKTKSDVSNVSAVTLDDNRIENLEQQVGELRETIETLLTETTQLKHEIAELKSLIES